MFNYYERVISKPEVYTQFAVKELLFVHYKCPMERPISDLWSQHNYIQYILTGKKGFHTPDMSWVFKAGDALFVRKGACITEKYFEETLCLITFFLPDTYLQNFIRNNRALNTSLPSRSNIGSVIPLHVNDFMNSYIESVIPYFYSENKPSETLLELKFSELLLTTLTDPDNLGLQAYLEQISNPNYDPFQQVMEANCLYNLSLEDYAKLLNLSLSSFKRHFASVYKTSPGQWLQTQKLNHAHKLLLNTNKSITDISFESGFENSTHFSHLFKKRFGASPLHYRKTETF